MIDTIFLIGYRGVGKTTVGKLLAQRLGYDFFDTDHYICQMTQMSIKEMVEKNGWDRFRNHEQEALVEMSTKKKSVIATGGGAILHSMIWEKIRLASTVIWLTAAHEIILQRLSHDITTEKMRPSLTGKSTKEEVEEVLRNRIPLYSRMAHMEIDTAELSKTQAVDYILTTLSSLDTEKKE